MTSPVTSATTPTAATAGGSGAADAITQASGLGKDDFMKMLVAQLQNQDPENPMDSKDLAVQLAQFSTVEQLMNINTTLGDQSTAEANLMQAVNSVAAVSAIGKTATATGNQVNIAADGSGSVVADIGGTGGTGTLKIMDSTGAVVGQRSLGILDGGTQQKFDVGSAADGLKPGTYTYAIDVQDFQNNPVNVTTYVTGRIDGVQYSATGAVFNMGGIQVPIGTIVSINAGN